MAVQRSLPKLDSRQFNIYEFVLYWLKAEKKFQLKILDPVLFPVDKGHGE